MPSIDTVEKAGAFSARLVLLQRVLHIAWPSPLELESRNPSKVPSKYDIGFRSLNYQI